MSTFSLEFYFGEILPSHRGKLWNSFSLSITSATYLNIFGTRDPLCRELLISIKVQYMTLKSVSLIPIRNNTYSIRSEVLF